ncbi:hypothetical protein ACTMTI_36670 [Nonomuraea sp. H19]|uniref:hypothetical protein n=1 Tax=Nonomuraea sp. H19 TaxID=3452206 RepID=UPI003F8BC6A9
MNAALGAKPGPPGELRRRGHHLVVRGCGPSANVMAIRMWSTLLAGAAHDVTGESTEEAAVADASS